MGDVRRKSAIPFTDAQRLQRQIGTFVEQRQAGGAGFFNFTGGIRLRLFHSLCPDLHRALHHAQQRSEKTAATGSRGRFFFLGLRVFCWLRCVHRRFGGLRQLFAIGTIDGTQAGFTIPEQRQRYAPRLVAELLHAFKHAALQHDIIRPGLHDHTLVIRRLELDFKLRPHRRTQGKLHLHLFGSFKRERGAMVPAHLLQSRAGHHAPEFFFGGCAAL